MRSLSGWWRLWIVLSALWVVLIGVMFAVIVRDIPSATHDRDLNVRIYCATYDGAPRTLSEIERCDDVQHTDYVAKRRASVRSNVITGTAFALVPPAILLILAILFRWVFRGFRKHVE